MAATSMLEVWYAHLDMDELLPRFQSVLDSESTPKVWRAINKARAHDSLQAFEKLCTLVDGEPRFVNDPPLLVPVELFVVDMEPEAVVEAAHTILRNYRHTLSPDRRHLLEQYRFVHLARKVVGVGSVGMDAWIALLIDRDTGAPLLLQIKEAEASVLERFTEKSEYENHGERVVVGQRLMQAASDIFLGWERSIGEASRGDYYIRQLRDWKGSADIAGMTPRRHAPVGPDVRLDIGPCPRPHRRPHRDRGLPRIVGHLRRAIVDFSSTTPTRTNATTGRWERL